MKVIDGSNPSSDPEGPTGGLCTFLATTGLERIPTEVVTRAAHLVLDGIGCGLLAARLPWSERAVRVMSGLDGHGAATVWGWDTTAPPGTAALLNGTFVQGFELDDYHPYGPLHSEACVLPPVLATAEHLGGVTGRQVLEAACLGFEVGPRIGMALGGLDLVSRGWHCGAVFGTPASAAGVGKLYGLDAAGFEDALGIAGTQAAGLMAAQFEAMVKRMHSGLSARNGLYGAALAAAGFSGIKRVVEREYGGLASTFGSPEAVVLDRLTAGLGEHWEISRIAVKPPYACMAGLHATIDGLLALSKRAELTPETVRSVRVLVGEAMYRHAGWTLESPATAIGAQMNLGYAAAVVVADHAAFVPQFAPDRINRADVWELMERVEVGRDASLDQLGEDARWASRLEVSLVDGTALHVDVRHPWGGRERPLTNEEIRGKYRRMAGLVIEDADRVAELERTVLNLADEQKVDRLTGLLRAPVHSPFPT